MSILNPDIDDSDYDKPQQHSAEYLQFDKEFEELRGLAEKSLKGDAEAKEKLNNSDETVKELITRIEAFLADKEEVPFGELSYLIGLKNTLEESLKTPCLEPFKKIGDLSDLPVVDENDLVERDGKKYTVDLRDCIDWLGGGVFTGAEYGKAVEEALAKLEDNKVVTLFNGIQVLKQKGVLKKVVERQLNKARSFEDLEPLIDIANGKAIRTASWRTWDERESGFADILGQCLSVVDYLTDKTDLKEFKVRVEEILATINDKLKENKE